MSYQGQTWVDEVALPRLHKSGELLVMLRVANHAGNGYRKMSGCWASSEKLAVECLMGQSTVLNHLRNLAKRGLLIPGDPQLVAHLPADKRPNVYDLAGAHEEGCIGGHTDLDDCQITTGAQIEHPQKKPRSAGVKNEHPSRSEGGAGAQKQRARVLKSSTKGSKDLKVSSLSAEAGVQQQAAAAEGEEREKALQQDNGTERTPVDAVVEAYVMAYAQTVGMPPRPHTVRKIRGDAAALLAAGRSVKHLEGLAAELAHKGWDDLAKHLAKNPEPGRTAAAAAAAQPWCGQCPPPGHPDHRWLVPDDEDEPAKKCSCFSAKAMTNA
ncbi:helix-turn-helix domain-containing protein (plasmid) [Streptomyces anulatus]|uniref:hypothetical protein n=1 Tax=Streptomyces anulatus TaxID=1892 RepID=UPI0032453CF4